MNLFEERPDYAAMQTRELTFAEARSIYLLPDEEKFKLSMVLLTKAGRRLIEELAVTPRESEFYKAA